MKKTRWAAVAVAVAATALVAAAPASAQRSTLIFDQEFNGPQGSTPGAPWTVVTGQGFAANQCWVNDSSHVSETGSGYLSLTATYAATGNACGDGNYNSGAIQVPADTWSYRYGTAEASVEVPCQSGTGVWPSSWQYASQNGGTSADNGEIDSMEILSAQWSAGLQNAVTQAIHGSGLPTDASQISWRTTNANPWCGAFHRFGNIWTPTSVTFTIDGVAKHTFNKSQFSAWPLVTPQAPVLSLLVGQFGGTPDPSTFPQTMLVDWLHICSGKATSCR